MEPLEKDQMLESTYSCNTIQMDHDVPCLERNDTCLSKAEQRKLKSKEASKKYRQLRSTKETPEQCAQRLLKMKESYEKQKEKHKMETPEQTAERLLKNRERYRIYRTAKRHSVIKENNKRLQMRRKAETPEQYAKRMATNREQSQKIRQRKLEQETSEERAERLLVQRLKAAKYREIKRARKEAGKDVFEANDCGEPIVKYENIDDNFDDSYTCSSFGGSEGINSRTSLDGSRSRTTTKIENKSMMQYNCEVKSEPSRDTTFYFQIFEIDSVKNEETPNKEHLSIKRTKMKSENDVCEDSIAPAIVQEIIVKEELDF